MHTFISLLRGINVSGHNLIRMADLKALYESLGFSGVQTYILSGNVIFESPDSDRLQVAERIEQGIRQTLKLDIPVFIRTADDLQRLVEANPYINGRSEDPSRVAVTFTYRPLEVNALEELARYKDPVDEFVIFEHEIFLFCPNGFGRSKLNNTLFEKKLGVPTTARNWKTVTTLLEMARK